jgi:hypothetical protein
VVRSREVLGEAGVIGLLEQDTSDKVTLLVSKNVPPGTARPILGQALLAKKLLT